MAAPLNDAEVAKISAREQQRIAHDLHDGLGQLLGGIALKAQVLHETLAEKSLGEAAGAAEIVALVNEALAQTRLLVRGLDPVAPPAATLATMLTKLAANTERLFRIKCTFEGDRTVALDSAEASQQLFRVAQEAVNNALRHGKARAIELLLTADEREVTLSISDNGIGFAKAPASSGIGLRIMSHRLASLGGSFEMGPGVTTGTIVRCCLPRGASVS